MEVGGLDFVTLGVFVSIERLDEEDQIELV